MKQHETIANATDQPIPPTTNASAELEKAGSAIAETDKSKKDGNEQPNKWVVFAILAVGIFMATLDTSIVNISLPTIAHFFSVPLSGAVEWVIIAYLVVTAGVLLTVGRLADSVGRKPIWVAGLIIFTAGSALSGASVSLGMLIAARALQGLGGAFVLAISPAMLTSAFPANERGRALGLNAVIVALGVSVGPTLGGIITENFSWNWIFYVNVPLGIIGIIATLRVLRESANQGRERFDPVGALLLAIGLVTLTLGLSFGQQWGWNSPLLISTLVISALGFIGLVIVEQRVSNPIIDVVLLRSRVFLSANVSLILSFLALFAVSFLLPFYLEELRGYSTLQAGLLLTPLALTIAVVAPFSGTLADRIGTRWLASAGLAIACVGLVFMSQLNAQSSTFDIIWRLVFTGVGQALFQSPNNSALMGAAPRGHQGSASGFLATGRVVGQSVSVALAGAIFASLGGSAAGRQLVSNQLRPTLSLEHIRLLQQTFAGGFHTTFIVLAGIAAVGVFTSLVRGKV
jgi:EmrB/QacA subfamily drug resistance transporter